MPWVVASSAAANTDTITAATATSKLWKGSGFYANLTPAIVFFPVPQFAMSASIGSLDYNHMNYEFPQRPNASAPSDYENTSNGFGANFG